MFVRMTRPSAAMQRNYRRLRSTARHNTHACLIASNSSPSLAVPSGRNRPASSVKTPVTINQAYTQPRSKCLQTGATLRIFCPSAPHSVRSKGLPAPLASSTAAWTAP